jgi:hypothetical protein
VKIGCGINFLEDVKKFMKQITIIKKVLQSKLKGIESSKLEKQETDLQSQKTHRGVEDGSTSGAAAEASGAA